MKLTIVFGAAILFYITVSCKKSIPEPEQVAALNVVNAVVGGKQIKLNSWLRDSARAYNYRAWGVTAGESRKVYLYPVGDSLKPYYNQALALKSGHLYSLFLCGQPGAVDTLLTDDAIPDFYTDSSMGIRLINLSSGKKTYSVTRASNVQNLLFSNIGYKAPTDFVKLSLRSPVPASAVTFQVRDASNKILASYTLPENANSTYANVGIRNARGRNLTLVIRGAEDAAQAANAIGLFPVPHY
ncbi:hypothetical protein HNQ91_002042 [Filimonas zeae]|uniref:DUF4397 domain-containing protein n=1 Tax=Filimonas zeae TaxID=1737353 RepID=A0A917IYL2_9BACT|nr:hypothetical protein [Filimonas zeae]MDR6338991.1 hypothetical protein [Filimonas zeae]GGH65629.1 hypothetical protein GCM10011379_18960 [Filimonas zeae]